MPDDKALILRYHIVITYTWQLGKIILIFFLNSSILNYNLVYLLSYNIDLEDS